MENNTKTRCINGINEKRPCLQQSNNSNTPEHHELRALYWVIPEKVFCSQKTVAARKISAKGFIKIMDLLYWMHGYQKGCSLRTDRKQWNFRCSSNWGALVSLLVPGFVHFFNVHQTNVIMTWCLQDQITTKNVEEKVNWNASIFQVFFFWNIIRICSHWERPEFESELWTSLAL